MKRIDLMSKEEIVYTFNHQTKCIKCPVYKTCDGNCAGSLAKYLFEEVEMIPRASLYKKGEEACEEFFGDAFHNHKYSEPDIVDFAEFLMEKVPKPLDKSEKV